VSTSQTLTAVKLRYSQTEKQALAIVWPIEKLHIYLYWSNFKMIIDRKSVQLVLSNPKSKPPAWIECCNLRLQSYDLEAIHTEGCHNPSDYLSYHLISKEDMYISFQQMQS